MWMSPYPCVQHWDERIYIESVYLNDAQWHFLPNWNWKYLWISQLYFLLLFWDSDAKLQVKEKSETLGIFPWLWLDLIRMVCFVIFYLTKLYICRELNCFQDNRMLYWSPQHYQHFKMISYLLSRSLFYFALTAWRYSPAGVLRPKVNLWFVCFDDE